MRLAIVFFTTVFSLTRAWEWGSNFEKLQVVDLSSAQPDSRIVGGAPADIKFFPYTVQVQRNNQLTCGGALLTQRHVLSAAHCFVESNSPIPVSQFTVRAGTSQLGSGGSVYKVSLIVIHHQYSTWTQDADVAVMVLSSKVTLGANVGVAKIPAQGQMLNYNTPVVHVGWGQLQAQIPTFPSTLQAVTVLKVNWTVCAQRYMALPVHLGGPLYLTSNMMCAGLLDVGGADACYGDSGGPLLYADIVVGITSWGYSCGHPTYPGVNARVSAFTNWINQTVVQYNSSPALGSTNAMILITSILASLAFMSKEV